MEDNYTLKDILTGKTPEKLESRSERTEKKEDEGEAREEEHEQKRE